MKLLNLNKYIDCGSLKITTDNSEYCIDNREKSKTKGKMFLGYPKPDNSNLIKDSKELEKEIFNSIEETINKMNEFKVSINEMLNPIVVKKEKKEK